MQFRILGPLEVRGPDGGRLVPNRRKERVLLGAFLLSPNELVTRAALVDALWGPSPPRSATANLHSYVADLRRLFGGPRLVAERGGYRLVAGPGELDAAEFERLAGEGRRALRAGDQATAAERLARALSWWRGPVLEGIELPDTLEPARARLEGARLDTLEASIEARLALAGTTDAAPRSAADTDLAATDLAAADLAAADLATADSAAADLAAELEGLVRQYPLREQLWGQLMRALAAAGRRADALAAYQRLAGVLDTELAATPGPRLRQLHERIRTLDTAPTPAPAPARRADRMPPRQLPADLATFAGRAAQLRDLDQLLPGGSGGAVSIAAISGPAGMGKTTLAVRWAHRNASHFPDGQLYVNLRGFAPGGPVGSDEALRGFLAALGVPPREVPAGLDGQAALYRSLVADRRVLVVLDNAADAGQVRPLLPAGAGCLALVTSRNQLAGLLTQDGAHPLGLELPSTAEAGELLARRIGAGRVESESGAAAAIIDRCGRLPLALAIVATRAALRPDLPLAAVAAELAGTAPLDALADGDGTDLRTVISWTYQLLSPAAARLLRLLAVHPGPDITAAAATSLAAAPAGAALAELAAVSLLAECHPGRYAMHDLLRAYAGELAGDREQAATRRVLDHYLRSAHAAALLVEPHRPPIQLPPAAAGVRPEQPADPGAALAWFDAERAVLGQSLLLATREGFPGHACQLAWSLAEYLERQGRNQDWLAASEVAVAAAARLGDPAVLADAYRRLAGARAKTGDVAGAGADLGRALALFEQVGATAETGQVYLNLASMAEAQEEYAVALEHAEHSMALFQAAGDEVRAANARGAAGWYLALLGRHEPAMVSCRAALEAHQRLGNRSSEAVTWDTIGYLHQMRGEYPEAIDCYRRAAGMFRELGIRNIEWMALDRLGDTCRLAGDRVGARAAWQRAVRILTDLEHPALDRVRAKLTDPRG
jgi:DNA-binding SARP family transcriptional activator